MYTETNLDLRLIIPDFQRALVAVERTLTALQPIPPNPRISPWRPQFYTTGYKCSITQSCLSCANVNHFFA